MLKEEPTLSPCDPVEIVENCVDKFKLQAEAKGIRLLFKKPDFGNVKIPLVSTVE